MDSASVISHLEKLADRVTMTLSLDGERELVVAPICTDSCVCVCILCVEEDQTCPIVTHKFKDARVTQE
jgi:hypothetical protein